MIDTLLHSGEFSDNNGDVIRVSFYKRMYLEIMPESFSFSASFNRTSLQIFLRGAEGTLSPSTEEWFICEPYDPIVVNGSSYYSFNIVCLPNDTGSERSITLRFTINTGPDTGKYVDIPITQSA